ncbi:MAG: alginate export family protein [Candidatus Omnitrophica bacterium]|nr:alginate export family protein [Candidatus Omnitrophota bacterium]
MSSKLLVAFAAVCILSIGAFAAVENIKVSGDITATAVNRDFSLGNAGENLGLAVDANTGHGNPDAEQFAYSQVRLRFDADLTEGVSAVVRLINERLWGSEDVDNGSANTVPGGSGSLSTNTSGGDTEIDLDLAYIEMKEFLYEPLTVIVGRQNLRYGNALIIGDPDTNQTASVKVPVEMSDMSLRKSFDAVRAILDYSPYTIESIYAAVDENVTNINDDRNIWGSQITYDWASYNGVTEGYFFHSNQSHDNVLGSPIHVIPEVNANSVGGTQIVEDQSYTNVVGGRFQYDPNDKWTLGLEGAYQFGDIHIVTAAFNDITGDPYQHLSAYAIQAMAQYRFLNDYNAMLQLEYTYLSGDDDLTDERHTAWDPMFEDQSSGEIINILFPQSGTQCVTLRGSMMPREDITIGGLYTYLLLSEKVNYDVNAANAVVTYNPLVGPAVANTYNIEGNGNYLGSEIDAYMLYDYTEDVQIKLSGATFIPGDFWHHENNSPAYSLKAGVSVDF